ncbi:MAG TPA: M56 family metallopeptidase [Tepidisphaeraceae bacterium]|nr:M56 family metallopeptidase [Tepidisphaeraceae bacterium]
MGGGVMALAGMILRYWRLRSRIVRSSVSPPANVQEVAEMLARKLGLRRAAGLRVCDGEIGPAVFGLFRPVLLVPRKWAEHGDPGRLRAIVAHEIVHLRRRDPLVAAAQMISQAVWWFNPLVWWMNMEINRTRELCCDAEVVDALACPPADYAQTLIDVLRDQCSRRPMPAMGIYPITQSRIQHIMENTSHSYRRMSWRRWALAGLCAMVILPGAGIRPASQARADGPPTMDAVGSIAEVTHFVRIVVDSDVIRFQGKPVSPEQLPSLLARVPDRPHTILEIGYAADDVTMGQYMKAFSLAANDRARRDLGFEGLSEIGKQPADSVGSDDRCVYAALTPAPESALTSAVPFTVGRTQFTGGDRIVITSVRGDRDHFEIGGTYQVRGTYHLESADKVTMSLWISARLPGQGWGNSAPGQFTTITRGDGTFTLTDRIPVAGYPHINMHIHSGNTIGDMYFGSGEWLDQ